MYIVAIFCKFSLDLKTIFFQAQKLLKKIGIEGVKVMLININMLYMYDKLSPILLQNGNIVWQVCFTFCHTVSV